MSSRMGALICSSLDAATLTGGMDLLCSGTTEACSIIRIINASTVDILISYDEVNVNDYVMSRSALQLPLQANSRGAGKVLAMQRGQRVWVNGFLGAGTGYIYLAGYYPILT